MPFPSKRKAEPTTPGAPQVTVTLLGAPKWSADGGAARRLAAKDAALLAKLALDGPQARAALCDLLWPDKSPEKAYANLRSRASRFYVATRVVFVEIDEHVRLNDALKIDVLDLARTDPKTLLDLGALLAGIDIPEHDELERWLADARARMAESCADALGSRAEALEREGQFQDALALARKAVELQPLSETCWHRVMQLHYLRNDRAAARDVFLRCSALFRDELGIRPGQLLLDLMQTVDAADRTPVSRHRPVPASILRPPILIGRHAAWQAMWSAWQLRQPFLVVGDAGMGKSRLLEEFCQGLEGVVWGHAAPGEEDAPYALLGRVLIEVEQRYAPDLKSLDRMELARLRPEFGVASKSPASAVVLERAVEKLLSGAIQSGLRAIVLDDLHYADTATLETLRRLGIRGPLSDLRLGLAARPVGSDRTLSLLSDWSQASDRLVRIDLPALTPVELKELMASLMLPSLLDSSYVERIYRYAGGHPLYTLATLHASFVSGGDPLASSMSTPSSIQALLDARIAALPSASHDLLRIAAIAGPDLTAERAARMLDCSILALSQRWGDLEAADVLRGETFSHDLIYEAALRTVPLGVRQALHRQFAGILAEEATVGPARLAWHWERGERVLEAARCWHAAAKAAGAVARLEQQSDLYWRAAQCFRDIGESGPRFESLIARIAGLQLRPGGAAVLEALPEAEALADSDERKLRCRLAKAEALLGLEEPQRVVEEARKAVEAASLHRHLQADAEALMAQGLVQLQQFSAATAAAKRAVDLARSVGDPWQTLRALQAMSFVQFGVGNVHDSISWQQEAVKLAVAVGHRYEAAAGEGHVAALWAVVGDVSRAYAHAKTARDLQREVGIDEDGTVGSVNYRVLGVAAASLGRFDEALTALESAVATAGAQAAPGAMYKARLSLAGLWLTLGRSDLARACLDDLPPDEEPARMVQQNLLRAQAAEAEGASSRRYFSAIAKIGADNPDLPLVRSIWFEWSYQGNAKEAIACLQRVRLECESLLLHGTARGFQWRELVRWLDIPGAEATDMALAHARQLAEHVEGGMSAKCYPPEVWLTLSAAHARAGETRCQLACIEAAKTWLGRALLTVPQKYRKDFANGNPLHRRLMSG